MTPTTRRPFRRRRNDVVAGDEIGVGGAGFAPNATITLLWADGAGQRTTVLADKSGNFLISMPVAGNERPGDRLLVAQTPGTGTDPASVGAASHLPARRRNRRRLPRLARRLIAAAFGSLSPKWAVCAQIGDSDCYAGIANASRSRPMIHAGRSRTSSYVNVKTRRPRNVSSVRR